MYTVCMCTVPKVQKNVLESEDLSFNTKILTKLKDYKLS